MMKLLPRAIPGVSKLKGGRHRTLLTPGISLRCRGMHFCKKKKKKGLPDENITSILRVISCYHFALIKDKKILHNTGDQLHGLQDLLSSFNVQVYMSEDAP